MPKKECACLTQLHQSLSRFRDAGQGLLLAVSGGMDSMVMLHAIRSLSADSMSGPLTVAHLNHGLRGSESELDAELVRKACAAAGVPCFIETLPSNNLKVSSRGSLEEAARAARYGFLQRTAISQRLTLIATAHHQQDQAETVLFSLIRGTGMRGMRGIPESRSLSEGMQIIRPMLRIPRETIRQYATAHGIEFREDSSNRTCEFARNRIRQMLKSLPAAVSVMLERQLLALSDQAAASIDAMDAVAEQILAESVLEGSPAILRIDRARLAKWPEPLVRHALILLWTRQQWPRQKMNSAHWQRLCKAALTGSPSRWSFPGGVQLSMSTAMLRLEALSASNGRSFD